MMPNKHRTTRKRQQWNWEMLMKAARSSTAQCGYVVLGGMLVLLILFLTAITPERYDLKVGDIAHTTITASKDVVDEISTARQREEAARLVEPSYLFKEGVTDEVMQALSQILSQVSVVQQYGQNILEQHSQETAYRRSYEFTTAEVEYAKSLLTLITLTDYQLNTLLRATDQQMVDLSDNVSAAVENTMNTTIREGYVNESIQYIQQIVAYKTDIDLLQNVVTPILRKCIKPNMVIDQAATSKLQEDARDAVEPVIYKQGQNIVLARERVTANQLEMLRSLGLLDDDTVDVVMYVGGAVLVLASVLALLLFLRLFEAATLRSPKRLMIIMIVQCIALILCIGGQLVHVYMTPVLLAAMMLTGLLGVPAGMGASLAMALLSSGIVAGGDSTYGAEMINLLITGIISGLISVSVLRQKPYRQQILLCGVITAVSNFLIVLCMGFMTNTSIHDVFNNAVWSAASALIASLLCVGLDPLIESFFHLATPSKLLELSNPNQPLLRRLLMEAPGTYHHSIIVANLAEAAAEAIGANPLLARAGAYYHDIGKLKRPLYFKENQMGENPHTHTNPYVSAAIVTAHTRDGLMMAQQNHLPSEIQDIIIEHHGDTPVMYFYHKALQQANGQPVDVADFRYDGKRPHMKESAIVMLADTVEAAVRSMPDPTPKAIEEFIERLVRGKLEDGQLSNAPITLRDIDKICDAFSTVLNGVFHERIEYPMITPGGDGSTMLPEPPPADKTVPSRKPEDIPSDEVMHSAEAAEPFARPDPQDMEGDTASQSSEKVSVIATGNGADTPPEEARNDEN